MFAYLAHFDLLKPANYHTFHEKNQGYFGDLSHLKLVENTGDWSHILLFMELIQTCAEIIDFYWLWNLDPSKPKAVHSLRNKFVLFFSSCCFCGRHFCFCKKTKVSNKAMLESCRAVPSISGAVFVHNSIFQPFPSHGGDKVLHNVAVGRTSGEKTMCDEYACRIPNAICNLSTPR